VTTRGETENGIEDKGEGERFRHESLGEKQIARSLGNSPPPKVAPKVAPKAQTGREWGVRASSTIGDIQDEKRNVVKTISSAKGAVEASSSDGGSAQVIP
jgi:hypothetical protein